MDAHRAILNRINFGRAVAAGRLPGADIRLFQRWIRFTRPRGDKQVDAVVATILNGMVSPDTRAVLVSGEHPMLANGAGGNAIQDMSPRDTAANDAGMARQEMADGGAAARMRPNQIGGARRAALQGRGFANLPQLTGLPQIVGLALGSPEFQRH